MKPYRGGGALHCLYWVLGKDDWNRDGGMVELRIGKRQLSPVQLQPLLLYPDHLFLQGSLSFELALCPLQHHQILPLQAHQRLAVGAGCYCGLPC